MTHQTRPEDALSDVSPKPRPPKILIVVLVGFPFVAVFALALTGIFYVFGYRYHPGALPIPSLIAVVVGTPFVVGLRERARPSIALWYGALACYLILALALWARVTGHLPAGL